MATAVIHSSIFPAGTQVGAYDATGFSSFPAAGPPGGVIATGESVVGEVAFSGLTIGKRYFAAAKVNEQWREIAFTVDPIAPSGLTEEEVIAIIEKIAPSELSEEQVKELIEEIAGEAGLSEGEVKTLIEDLAGEAGLTEEEVTAIAESVLGSLNAFQYKGAINCSGNPKYPAAKVGDTYTISVAGKIGGASGDTVAEADLIICNTDAAEGTKVEVGSKWNIVNAQLTVEAGVKVEKEAREAADALRELLSNKDTTATLGTSDTKYPSQKAVKTYADLRELLSNKDTTGTLGTSDTKYPSQKAVKTYADATVKTEEERAKTAEATKAASSEIAAVDTSVTLASNSDEKVASQKATKTYVDSPGGLVVPLLTGNAVIGAAFGPSIKKIYGLRVKIGKTGTLHDLSIFIGAKAGKGIVGLYDTGDANAGNYTKLGSDSGEVEPTANEAWKVMLDPSRAVVRGEDLMLAVIWSTGTTITIGRGASGAGVAGALQLPTSFIPTTGAASPKLAGVTAEQTEFKLPEKIAEAALLATGNVAYPQIVARIS